MWKWRHLAFLLVCPISTLSVYTWWNCLSYLRFGWSRWSGEYQHWPFWKDFVHAILSSRTQSPSQHRKCHVLYGPPLRPRARQAFTSLWRFCYLSATVLLCGHHQFVLPLLTLSLGIRAGPSSHCLTHHFSHLSFLSGPDTVSKSVWRHGLSSWATFSTKSSLWSQTSFNLSS